MGGGQRWSRGELHGSVTRILRRRYGRTGELQQQTAFPDASVADDYVLEEIGIFVEHATGQEGTENEPFDCKSVPMAPKDLQLMLGYVARDWRITVSAS